MRTMRYSSTAERQRQVIVLGIVRSCECVYQSTAQTNGRMIAGLVQNKLGVLGMSAEAIRIRDVRSSSSHMQAISSAPSIRNPRN
ncbi:hypothetical protein TNCV_2408631 [Trichonephila clavipes]|nr:hypothetical protein TNCV_2408631 [Trichonephila clavipes]